MLKSVAFFINQNPHNRLQCLGSILNSEWLLVPATCVNNSNYSIKDSSDSLEIRDVDRIKVYIAGYHIFFNTGIDRIIINTQFKEHNPNSLALVHLTNRLDLDFLKRRAECLIDKIKPIDKAKRLVRISIDNQLNILKDYKNSMYVNENRSGNPFLFIKRKDKNGNKFQFELIFQLFLSFLFLILANFKTDLFFMVNDKGKNFFNSLIN